MKMFEDVQQPILDSVTVLLTVHNLTNLTSPRGLCAFSQ